MVRDGGCAAIAQAFSPASTQPTIRAAVQHVGSAHLILGRRCEGLHRRLADSRRFRPSATVFSAPLNPTTMPVGTLAPAAWLDGVIRLGRPTAVTSRTLQASPDRNKP
jgi:hypothetical protein